MSDVLVGVDLGGTFIKTAVVSREGKVLHKDSRPTGADEGLDAVLGRMEQAVRDAVSACGTAMSNLQAVGFGAPGPMNWQTGIVYSPPNLPGWKDVPLADLMTKRLGVPCYVDNDANVACYGEFWLGAGRDVESMVLLTLGTGVGGGIVVMDQLLRGPDGTAAEIGHMCVKRGGRVCGCGAQGCLEQYASVSGMVRTAVKGLESGHQSLLADMCNGDYDQITGKMISDAVSREDGFAAWVMEETGAWLGIAIGTLINLLNPEKVVLAGGMVAAGETLFKPIREAARAQCFQVPGERAQIVPAELDPDSGVIGAAGTALQRLAAS